jgi:hypothetical protein
MITGAIRDNTWKNNRVYFQAFASQVVDLWLIG